MKKLKRSTLLKYAKSDLLERWEGDTIYFHSERCPSYCDYACNGPWGFDVAKQVEAAERHKK